MMRVLLQVPFHHRHIPTYLRTLPNTSEGVIQKKDKLKTLHKQPLSITSTPSYGKARETTVKKQTGKEFKPISEALLHCSQIKTISE